MWQSSSCSKPHLTQHLGLPTAGRRGSPTYWNRPITVSTALSTTMSSSHGHPLCPCLCPWVLVPKTPLLLLFSHSVVSNSLRPRGLQHSRLLCPSTFPSVCSDSCPLSWDAIQPSHLLPSPSPPALNLAQHQGLCPVSRLFTSGGQSI